MKRICFTILILFLSVLPVFSQKNAKNHGVAYFAFGSHRIFYTPSDIRLRSNGDPSFDFVIKNAEAKDEGGLKWATAPQFSYTGGYYFNKKKFGIEYQYDHIKYFLKQNQVARVRGNLGEKYIDVDTVLTRDLIKLEHSDGGNYAMINLVKWIPLIESEDGNHVVQWIVKGGVGLVNPKTNSEVLGKKRDDRYHISGYVVGAETGLRYNFLKHFFVTGSFKGAYANYNNFLIADGRGSQKWWSGQFNYLIGGQVRL